MQISVKQFTTNTHTHYIHRNFFLVAYIFEEEIKTRRYTNKNVLWIMGKTGYTCIRKTFCSINILVWVGSGRVVVRRTWCTFQFNVILMIFCGFFLTQICGSCFLGLGLWLRLSYEGYASLLPENAGLSADCILMTFGVLSLVISFFGCCGSWFQSRCLLSIVSTLIEVSSVML